MKLREHFKQHLQSDIATGSALMLESILADPEALAEHEETIALWFDFDLKTMGEHLGNIVRLELLQPSDWQIKVAGQHMQQGERLADLWLDSLRKRIAAMYAEVDIAALLADEHEPFDSTHIESASA